MRLYSKVKKAVKEGGLRLLLERVMGKGRTLFASASFLPLFVHSMSRGLPRIEMKVVELSSIDEDVEIAKRIKTAFLRAINDKPNVSDATLDIWDLISEHQHKDLFDILNHGDASMLAEYLRNMHERSLAHGISDFNVKHKGSMSRKLVSQQLALVKDNMVSLAEALAAIPYQHSQENIYLSGDELERKIKTKLGIDTTPPDIDGGLVKVKFGDGYYSNRDIWAIYTAYRVSQVIRPESSVAEIGGGLGKTALYASRLGFHDYTIFDLPQVNIAQAWYLIKALPHKEVILYGEKSQEKSSIRILPYWEYTGQKYDLILNVDSFPEIDRKEVTEYLRKIKKSTRYFMSVNKESEAPYGAIHGPSSGQRHISIPPIIDEIGGFTRTLRFPFWLRKGYVEELYTVN